MGPFSTTGIRTTVIREGDDLVRALLDGVRQSPAGSFQDDDVLVIAENAVATAEGRVIELAMVIPGEESVRLGEQFEIDPRLVEVVLAESDSIVGGIPGFLLCMKGGTLLPNAGVDASNAPPGCVVPLPEDPDQSALRVRREIELLTGARVGVIIADSRTHAMRSGCSGVAIGCSGIPSVIDVRGRTDLFGRPLEVTRQAIADNIASAAEIVMGEADERIPAAVLRGLGILIGEWEGVGSIDADACLFMGLLKQREMR